MKVYQPAFPRGVSFCITTLFWTCVLGAVAVGLVKLVNLINRLEHPRQVLAPAAEQLLTGTLMAVFGSIAVLMALLGLFSLLSTRYVVGATELTVHSGAVWRHTITLPLLAINRIETSSGPLMRLFGLADLQIHTTVSGDAPRQGIRETASVTLRGLRDADEARCFLLDRRASLQEAALRGDLMVGNTPHEMQLQRLTDAIERLNHRLPRA